MSLSISRQGSFSLKRTESAIVYVIIRSRSDMAPSCAAGPVKRCDTVQINRLTGFYISVKIGISDLSVLITFLS